MLELLRVKKDILKSVLELTKELSLLFPEVTDDYTAVTDLLSRRQEKTDEIDAIDASIKDMRAAGGKPGGDDELIEAENLEILGILKTIHDIERGNAETAVKLRDKLIMDLKDVSDDRKRINAYVPPPVVNEGFEFDTRQ